jgi:hypothetical protein
LGIAQKFSPSNKLPAEHLKALHGIAQQRNSVAALLVWITRRLGKNCRIIVTPPETGEVHLNDRLWNPKY